METQEIYTRSDMEQLTSTELVAFLFDQTEADFSLQVLAKDILKERMAKPSVPLKALQSELQSQRANISRIYKMLLLEEIEHRKAKEHKQQALAKEQQRVATITGRKRKYQLPSETLLRADRDESIFKIKLQWHNTRFIETIYSRDYPSERSWFKGDQLKMLEQKLGQSSAPSEFFEKGGLRKSGFNGFLYNLSRFQRDSGNVCWFAIYLNNVLEQQPNGEFWSMEVYSFGKRLGKV